MDTPWAGVKTYTISYIVPQVIPMSEYESKMAAVRRGYGYEGCVFYFLDGRNHVVGLLKKKTAWYIVCRAIRHVTSVCQI
jgi:hypothetical protein